MPFPHASVLPVVGIHHGIQKIQVTARPSHIIRWAGMMRRLQIE